MALTVRRYGDLAGLAAVEIVSATDQDGGVLALGVLDVSVEHLPAPVLGHCGNLARVRGEAEAVDATGVSGEVEGSHDFLKVSTPSELHLPHLTEGEVSESITVTLRVTFTSEVKPEVATNFPQGETWQQ